MFKFWRSQSPPEEKTKKPQKEVPPDLKKVEALVESIKDGKSVLELLAEDIRYKTVEEKPCKVKFAVQVPWEFVAIKQLSAIHYVQQFAEVSGFRAGKAPLELVQKKFGEKIMEDVLDGILKDFVPKVLKKKNLAPVVRPVVEEIKIAEQKSLDFFLTVEYSPQFTVKNYREIPVTKPNRTVTDEDVAKELERLLDRNAQLVPADSETAEKNHFAVIDYECFHNGVSLPEHKGENQLIDLTAPQFVAGIAEGVLGLSPGQSKEIPVRFPAEYGDKKLAGQETIFKVMLRALKAKKLPNADDDFAKDFGLKSLDELKSKIFESLNVVLDKNARAETRDQVENHLIRENPIPVPESLVAQELEHLVNRAAALLRIGKEEIEGSKKVLREKYAPVAERNVRLGYLFSELARQESLFATDEELQAELEKALQSQPEKSAEVKKYFAENGSAVLSALTEQKTLNFLLEHAKITGAAIAAGAK